MPEHTSTVDDSQGVRTLRHQDTSAPVPKCPSDISAPITEVVMLVDGGSYVGRGGELKAVDAFSELWVLKSAQWCNRAIATSVENASCDYNYCYGVNVQGSLSCRLHGARVHHLNKSNYRM